MNKSIFCIVFSIFILAEHAQAQTSASQFNTAHSSFFYLLDPGAGDFELFYRNNQNSQANAPSPINPLSPQQKLEVDRTEMGFKGELALPISRDAFLSGGFKYGREDYKFKNVGEFSIDDKEELHTFTFLGGASYFVNDDFLIDSSLDMRISGDFDGGVASDSVDFFGSIYSIFRFNPGAELLFGVRKKDDFESISAYPVVGVRLLSETGKVHFSATLPFELALTYNAHEKVQLSLKAQLSGQEYEIDSLSQELKFFRQDRRLLFGAKFWATKHLSLNLEAGLNLANQIQFELNGRKLIDEELDASNFITFGLGYSL